MDDYSINIIILNQPIKDQYFAALYRRAELKICADGGANELYEYNPELTPDAVIGDFDSIRKDVKDEYSKRGCILVKDADQYSTDFQKCVRYVQSKNAYTIVTWYGHGRMDHVFHAMHVIYSQPDFNIILISPTTLMMKVTKDEIELPEWLHHKCGLIPFGGECRLTIHGFEWDVRDWPTSLTGHVSTSNSIATATVSIASTLPIIFTLHLCLENGD